MSRWLLLDRAGSLWALGHEAVRAVERRGGGFRVRVAGGDLEVDSVLGVVEGLELHVAGPVLQRFWREPVGGLAVHGARPLVVLDPERPPSVFGSWNVGEGTLDVQQE